MELEKDKKIALLLEDLASLEAYINDIFNFSPLPLCFVSPSGVILESNPAFEKFSKFAFDEIIGKPIEDFFDKDDIKRILQETREKGLGGSGEINFFPKKGEKLIVQIFSRARKDEKGNFLGLFLGFSDLTDIKRKADNSRRALMNILEDVKEARWKAEEEKNKTLAIINNFADGIIMLDQKNNVSLINPRAKNFFSIEKEIIGRNISQIPELKSLSKKETFRQELELSETMTLEITILPVFRGEVRIGKLIILHNVTREKMIEKLKTEFVSLAAHQLRTPLSAVKWILKMLLDGELGELTKEQKEFLEDGYLSNQRMINLVNDLLNVARIEEGRYLYRLTLTSLEKLIEPVILSFKEQAKKSRVALVFQKPQKSLPKTMSDQEKMVIVFENIINNAVRYTLSGGRVTISLKHSKKEIEVCVKDTGMGIPEKQKKNIFTKFFRGSNVVRKETDGSGLGLFICKNIIEAHGGRIWFESEENKGSAFYFTVPIKKK